MTGAGYLKKIGLEPIILHDQPGKGRTFIEEFEAVLPTDPDWILIPTWNKWWENTHIKPSERFGDTYSPITREFADRWKEG